MKKNQINKDVSEQDLKLIFDSFIELEDELKNEIKQIMENEKGNGVLYKSSHFIFSVVNRAISLNRGFVQLTNLNNYLTAISLIRLQVDNCLRLYAMSLVDNTSEFYDSILAGKEIRQMKDRDGNTLNDGYLAMKIDSIFPDFLTLYKSTCGFIHLSNEHLKFNNKVNEISEGSLLLRTTIGGIDEPEIYEKVDYSFNMFMAGKSLYKLVKEYRKEMEDIYSFNNIQI